MGQWIDNVARALATGASRRHVLRLIGGGAAAAAVATHAAVEQAEAKPKPKVTCAADQINCPKGSATCVPRDNTNCTKCGKGCSSGTCCPTPSTKGGGVCCTPNVDPKTGLRYSVCCSIQAGGGCCAHDPNDPNKDFPQCCSPSVGGHCCPANYVCVTGGCQPPSRPADGSAPASVPGAKRHRGN